MNGMTSVWIYSGYNSGSGFSYTHEWNFPPAFVVAQASFYYVTGEGLHKAGIVSYRYRPDPSGPEQSVSFGNWPSWQPYIYVDRLSSVTFGTVVGARQECSMLGNIFFW